ncbi:MAG: NAD-dependent epimerase/dehydratase family protein [Candidatus Helarchaeota archaeon]
MNVLVCGSEGYIGTHLCKKLADRGHTIERYDIKLGSPSFPLKTDFVVDLIAYPRILECERDHKFAYKMNVETLESIIKYCKKQQVPLLFGSSVEVFGDRADRISPNDPYKPKNFYACTKIMGEYLTKSVDHSIIVRFSHVFGHEDHYKDRLIPQLLFNPLPIIYNSIKKKLDFTHIDFVCDWLIELIEWGEIQKDIMFYQENIVTGYSFTIQEILSALNKDYTIKYDTFREKIEVQHQEFIIPSRPSKTAHILSHLKNGCMSKLV